MFSAHEVQQERSGKKAREEWPLFHFHSETHDGGLGNFSIFFTEYIFQSDFIKLKICHISTLNKFIYGIDQPKGFLFQRQTSC